MAAGDKTLGRAAISTSHIPAISIAVLVSIKS
jgi:hypothetical protein